MVAPPSPPEHSSRQRLLLGVDGGGTKTLAWLATLGNSKSPSTLGRGLSDASNPQAVGLEMAQQNIGVAIERAFQDAKLPSAPVAGACLALAGVGREPIRLAMLRWAQAVPLAEHVQVVHDARAVLAAGTVDGTGVAVICGTGSFAYGETRSGDSARSGGWGYLLGDEGSGFAIGLAALRAAARAADGRGSTTLLTTMILEKLQLTEPDQLIPTIYNAASVRDLIADLAPSVFQAAQDGDVAAREICQSAAVELGRLVHAVQQRLRFAEGQYDLALAGGVLVHQPSWAELLVRSLIEQHAAPRSTSFVKEPVAGAVLLASRSR